MREAGLKGLDFKEVSVVGLVEVLKKLSAIRARLKELKTMLKEKEIDLLVLIDFPDFNLSSSRRGEETRYPCRVLHQPPGMGVEEEQNKKDSRPCGQDARGLPV